MPDRPDLTDALAVLTQAARDADPAQVPALLGELEGLKAALWMRLAMPKGEANGTEDRLLTVDQAAEHLGVTRDWLRRRRKLPFVVKLSDGTVRYSADGLQQFIAAHLLK